MITSDGAQNIGLLFSWLFLKKHIFKLTGISTDFSGTGWGSKAEKKFVIKNSQ